MKVIVARVAEDSPEWVERVRMLAFSIRHFSGEMATAPIVAHFVGGARSVVDDRLDSLDVSVQVVEPFDPRCPWANKLRMLEARDEAHDVLLALDCDTVVMGDLRPRLSLDAVSAMVEWEDTLVDEQWEFLFGTLGLQASKSAVDPLRRRPTWPYLNSGVIAVPVHLASPLLASWSGTLEHLFSLLDRRPDIAARRNYLDQIALALALRAGEIPFAALPPALNCHTGGFPDGLVPPLEAPFLLHYHGHRDSRGFLRRSGNGVVDLEIQRFNLARAALDRVPYDRPPRRLFSIWMLKKSPLTRRAISAGSRAKSLVTSFLPHLPGRSE